MVYGASPWVFKGRALYQLQLVKTDEAKKHIPDCFKIVDFAGYTLGGFYLARYDESPVGAFDELVALTGIVWNPPTSCAWASRVYVNNKEARDHGLQHVGLPSRLASFSEASAEPASSAAGSSSGGGSGKQTAASWWRQDGGRVNDRASSHASTGPRSLPLTIYNSDRTRGRAMAAPVATLELPAARPETQWPGPRITLPLPSFSGATADHPGLLKYACQLHTNVRVVAPAAVRLPSSLSSTDAASGESMAAVLGGRPLIALAFDNMEMFVGEPEPLALQAAAARDAPAAAAKLASCSASLSTGVAQAQAQVARGARGLSLWACRHALGSEPCQGATGGAWAWGAGPKAAAAGAQ